MNDTKIPTNRARKIEIVSELSEKFAKAKALVFTNYQGLTHKQLEGLKKGIKPLDGEFVVAKNTLLKLALEKSNVIPIKSGQNSNLDEVLQNPTGTMFLYGDIIEPLKKLAKIIKEFNLPTVKFGILGSQALTSEQVLKLATLPSRETLIAQFVGSMKSPLYGLHRALNWNIQKLVLTLDQIKNQKENIKNT
ncbi:MAG: 50S ribosomal protein L10 [Patescibacteria group bacterium]|nr:50S ribosomal protein L10 [Patescibacteria group bacterium]